MFSDSDDDDDFLFGFRSSDSDASVDLPSSKDPKGFSKDELLFVETTSPLSVIEIECLICLQVMLKDPHLTSCCGHHFCGSCIERVKKSNGACPTCKEKKYTTFSDKNILRIINSLQVYCTNKESGCDWEGELRDLIGHVDKRERDGECMFEKVNCRHGNCTKSEQRQNLDSHEKTECPNRPFTCKYCNFKDEYHKIIDSHYNKCPKYPVPCTNKCEEEKVFERKSLYIHLNKECPLQPVECQFTWAGCREKPLRKDLPQHINDSVKDHFTVLAVACGEMKKKVEEMKKENEEMKKENTKVKEKNEALTKLLIEKDIISEDELEDELDDILPGQQVKSSQQHNRRRKKK